MRIAKSLMLGVAGSVLMAGGAMAADPMPIVVAAMPAATAPTTGREVVIDIAAGTYFGIDVYGLYLSSGVDGLIDVRAASGWGVRLEGYANAQIVPLSQGYASGRLTVYRGLGDLELGAWVAGGFSFPGVMGGYGVGLSANYEHESARLYLRSENSLQLLPYLDFNSYTVAEFKVRDNITLSTYFDYYGNFDGGVGIDVHLTDRLEVWSNLYYGSYGFGGVLIGAEFAATDRFSVWSTLGFDLSGLDDFELGTTFDLTDELSIKTELDLDFDPVELGYVETWAELDHPVGTGPLSLTAALGVGFDPDNGGLYAWGNVGIRYKLGVPEREGNRLYGDGPL